MRGVLKKLSLVLVGALFGFLVCELVARALFPAPIVAWPEPQIVYQYDPELKYSHVANQEGWIDDVSVRINSLGFRGTEVAVPKPTNRFRIVALGDSVTLGLGVSETETYSVRLQERLRQEYPARDIEVVNCGVSGYNTRQESALLERLVPRLQPSLVLVGFYMNDVPDALADSSDDRISPQGSTRILTAEHDPGRTLRMHHAPSQLNLLMRRSRAVYCASRTLGKLFQTGEWSNTNFAMELEMLDGKQESELLNAWGIVEDQFRRIQSIAESASLAVGVVVLPCLEQVMKDYPNAQYQTKVKQMGEQCGFLVIDPLERLRAYHPRTDELFVPYDRNHPSALGHDLIAQEIAECLAQHRELMTGHQFQASRRASAPD